jgi:predicted metalloprotease with PDZ domain
MLRKNKFISFIFFVFLACLPTVSVAKTIVDYTLLLNPESIDVTIKVSLKGSVWREKDNDPKADKSICFEHENIKTRWFWAKDTLFNNLKIIKEGKNKVCLEPNSDTFTFGYKLPISEYKGSVYTEDNQPVNISANDSIFVFGKNTFLIPFYKDETQIEPLFYLTLRRNKLKRLASSIELNNDRAEINSSEDLFSTVFIAGDISIKNEKIEKKNYLITTSGDWKGSQKKIVKNYKKIAQKQVSTWGFLPANYILSCFIRSKAVKAGFGFQHGNTIIYFLPEKLEVNDPQLLMLLAHEHFHIWNGTYYFSKEDSKSTEWFHEGFTNYYAMISVFSSGLISEADFLNYISSQYVKYDSSYNPAKPEKEKLLKDTFILMAIDIEIIRASGIKKNLDNLIKNISRNSQEWTKGYDNQLIKIELVKMANWDISSFFDNYISSETKINMEPYFAYLGLKQNSKLVLEKYKETPQYKKLLREKI